MINWLCKKFEELTPFELYIIMRLRNEVFVVEQHCIYQDADNKDKPAYHFMGIKGEELVAYSRIIPPGVVYPEASIGRVVTSLPARRIGLGKELMERSLGEVEKLFGPVPIRIGAQVYLMNFYSQLGFQGSGDPYLEDGIAHIEMTLYRS